MAYVSQNCGDVECPYCDAWIALEGEYLDFYGAMREDVEVCCPSCSKYFKLGHYVKFVAYPINTPS